jgi:hypothetical protein
LVLTVNSEPTARGYNWATLFLGDINTGILPLQVGIVSKIETIKYGREFRVTQI